MEFITRLAHELVRMKHAQSLLEGIDYVMRQYVAKAPIVDGHNFRHSHLYNVETNAILARNLEPLKQMFAIQLG